MLATYALAFLVFAIKRHSDLISDLISDLNKEQKSRPEGRLLVSHALALFIAGHN